MPIVPLEAELTGFICGDVSISIGSRDAAMLANLTRGFGCRVSPDRSRVRVFVSRVQSRAVLADIAANQLVAVVFTLPASHRTVQFKGMDALSVPLDDDDLDHVRAYRRGFVGHLASLGFSADTIEHLIGCANDELIAIEFTPVAAFTQTPGPRAGQPLARS